MLVDFRLSGEAGCVCRVPGPTPGGCLPVRLGEISGNLPAYQALRCTSCRDPVGHSEDPDRMGGQGLLLFWSLNWVQPASWGKKATCPCSHVQGSTGGRAVTPSHPGLGRSSPLMTDFFICSPTSWAGAVSALYSQAMSLSHEPPGFLLPRWLTHDADPDPPIFVDSETSSALCLPQNSWAN